MANKEVFTIDYQTDFGDMFNGLRWKVDRGMIERTGLNFGPVPISGRSCGTNRYFSPRKVIAKYTDGKSIEVIVGAIDAVGLVARVINGTGGSDLACISLKGESWSSIPPGILGGSYNPAGIDGTDKPTKTGVSYTYALDGGFGGNTLLLKSNFENSPQVIFDAQQSCLNTVSGGLTCGVTGGIKSRHFQGQRENTATGGKISRQIIVSSASEAEIKSCGASVMGFFNCLGYKGTSMANMKDFYDLS